MGFRRVLRSLGWLLLMLVVCLALIAWVPLPAQQLNADLTRFLWDPTAGEQPESMLTFAAQPGAASLRVNGSCTSQPPQIQLNGKALSLTPWSAEAPAVEMSVVLDQSNTIALSFDAEAKQCLSVRVTQRVEIEIHVLSRVHFNTNVSDFSAARAFYGTLGFDTASGFPDTNTQAMARAIGIETPTEYDGSQGAHAGGYLLHGELIGPGGFAGGVIDLIEFTIPRNEAPPYDQLNHLGMSRAIVYSADLDTDYKRMVDMGVSFNSSPVQRKDGTRFAIFRDLDGTSYELREEAGEAAATETTNIKRLGAVAINVSDFERSSAWYRLLGFETTAQLPNTDSIAVAKAMGFADPYRIEGAVVTHGVDGSKLELAQWLQPYDARPPYELPVNHLGIHRMAFSTSDIDADVAMLRAQGVGFVSPVTPCCSGDDSWGRIVAFYDPDGTVMELVEQPLMTPLLTLSIRLSRWFN